MKVKHQPISHVADALSLSSDEWITYGKFRAKVDLNVLDKPKRGKGNLILVSAINPTPGGEGKTTMSVGLAIGLRKIGRNAVCALREPSLGPVFGIKGGGTGGGRAQLEPATDINLHFNGDLHAITTAHNLLAALVDNALHFGTINGIEAQRITYRRCMDMNDRALRDIVIGLGGAQGGVPRQTGFDITAASETMAIFCLANSRKDLEERLGRMIVGNTREGRPISAADLGAQTAMAALLQDALMPNLVQTSEGGPAFVHGGPFANIAHGCSSVMGTRMAMHLADDVVTEAGFGFDLGAEKFLGIKCRKADLWPNCLVLVATLRALRFHGGQSQDKLNEPDLDALGRGMSNLEKHLESARHFGLPTVVAINRFPSDTASEIESVRDFCRAQGVPVELCTAFEEGGAGAVKLAETVAQTMRTTPGLPKFLYALNQSYEEKIEAIAKTIYGADGVDFDERAKKALKRFCGDGFGDLPVCMAKTHLSLSDRADARGRPSGFRITVREARLSAGAGFVVALLGSIMTMPGLPKVPAASHVRIDEDGRVRGLMQND